MGERKNPITPTEAKRNLKALAIMSGKDAGEIRPHRHSSLESEMQQALFEWAKYNSAKYPELSLLHSVPNGGKRDIATGAKLKREGVLSGVPDVHLPVARGKYHSLWIELKIGKNKPTERQAWFISEMIKQGSQAVVCYSLDEAVNVIEEYLKLNPS